MSIKGTRWCQFCDKEMVFAAMVKRVYGYITCGSGECTAKAENAAAEMSGENTEVRVVVSWTEEPGKTPWQLLHPGNYPENLNLMLQIPVLLRQALQPGIFKLGDNKKIWYSVDDLAEFNRLANKRIREQKEKDGKDTIIERSGPSPIGIDQDS